MSDLRSGDPAVQCNGKQFFASFGATQTVTQRKTRRGQPLTAYHCGHCQGWHLGHGAGSERSGKPKPAGKA